MVGLNTPGDRPSSVFPSVTVRTSDWTSQLPQCTVLYSQALFTRLLSHISLATSGRIFLSFLLSLSLPSFLYSSFSSPQPHILLCFVETGFAVDGDGRELVAPYLPSSKFTSLVFSFRCTTPPHLASPQPQTSKTSIKSEIFLEKQILKTKQNKQTRDWREGSVAKSTCCSRCPHGGSQSS